MFHWYPTWQQSAVAAVVLAAVGAVLRRRRPGVVATFAWEALGPASPPRIPRFSG